MRKVSIVGGHGFIGQNLCEYFQGLGYEIAIIGKNFSNKDFSYLDVQSFETEVENSQYLFDLLKDSEIVIWLANSLVPGVNVESLDDDYQSNIKPIVRFLEISKKQKSLLKKIIFLSSGGTVYGNSNFKAPISENQPKNPISAYGISKLVTEEYIKFLTLNSHFQSFILRPSNVYGKYQNLQKPQGIIGFAFQAAINNTPIYLYGGGEVVRDFIYVQDLAELVRKIIDFDMLNLGNTEIYNVGYGKPYAIKDVVDKIKSVSGADITIIHKESRSFDCEYNVLDIFKAKEKYFWKPKFSLEDGLSEVWRWINK